MDMLNSHCGVTRDSRDVVTLRICGAGQLNSLGSAVIQNVRAGLQKLATDRAIRVLVLAGSLMGGDISAAVEEVRKQGLTVISLNMAGSVPDAADLVVSDPVQAGVMAVMAIADTAAFDVQKLKRRVF